MRESPPPGTAARVLRSNCGGGGKTFEGGARPVCGRVRPVVMRQVNELLPRGGGCAASKDELGPVHTRATCSAAHHTAGRSSCGENLPDRACSPISVGEKRPGELGWEDDPRGVLAQ